MPVDIQGSSFPLSPATVNLLWEKVRKATDFPDEEVTVRAVSEAEIQELNKQYRHKDAPTNVLTFSYGADEGEVGSHPTHDIALCLAVAEREAAERAVELKQYTALLLVHAFLHAAGLDHEQGEAEERETESLEQEILGQAGFLPLAL